MAIRYDAGRFSRVTPTPQGGIRVDAAVSRTGILVYRNPDGSIRREYRPDEEVFHEDSLASLRGAPATQFHPQGMVTAETFRDVAVGYMGDDVRQDGDKVVGSMAIQDSRTVKRIQDKALRELSAGYTCRIENTPGEYQGQRYDAIQRDIRYNHVALLPPGAGRSGPEVALRLDSAGDCIAPEGWTREDQTMKIEIIDGTEYEVGTPAHTKASAARDKARTDAADALTQAEARADAAEAKVKDLEAKAEKEDERIDAAVSARLSLHREALRAGVEVKADASDEDIRRAVIGKVLPSVKLDGKEGAYLEAMFDLAVSQIEQASANGVRADAHSAAGAPPAGDAPQPSKADAARQKMIERGRQAWRADAKTGDGRSVAAVKK